MRLAISILLAASAGIAGPVGAYLGIEVGRTETGLRSGRDSIHYFLPSPADSVSTHGYADSTVVIAETIVGGDAAWIVRTHITGDTSYAAIDTSFESGDTMLYSHWTVGDSLRRYHEYSVPFAVDAWWQPGMSGTFIYDLNGDTLADTVTIWADTTRVLAVEDVTVPYGTVPACWKLVTTMRQSLALTYQGVPARETSYIRTWEWRKDSLWWVKDSTVVTGSAYTFIFIWLRAASFVSTDVGVLTGLWTGIAAPGSPAPEPGLFAAPNPARSRVTVTLDRSTDASVRIYDSGGRLARTLAVPPLTDRLELDLAGLPAGTYFIRNGRSVCRLVKTR